jgi:hypothetical protein
MLRVEALSILLLQPVAEMLRVEALSILLLQPAYCHFPPIINIQMLLSLLLPAHFSLLCVL